MDPAPILPDMFHPQRPWRTRDSKREIRPYTRTARPVKYYFTDFGLSSQYNADISNPLEIPILGGDKTVPEFQKDRTTPRNPFHTDVYYMGNLVRRDFLQVCVLVRTSLYFPDVENSSNTQILRSWSLLSLAWSKKIPTSALPWTRRYLNFVLSYHGYHSSSCASVSFYDEMALP